METSRQQLKEANDHAEPSRRIEQSGEAQAA